jgi:peroxiredoxin
MASRKEEKARLRQARERAEAEQARRDRARTLRLKLGGALGAAVVALGVLFAVSVGGEGGSSKTEGQGASGGGDYAFAVGSPGPGQPAPALKLPSTAGGTYDLAARRGKRVLLYFQEGLGCQPCWDQIKDIERKPGTLKALGIDEMVTITGNDLANLRQKASDERIKTPVLADPDLPMSAKWEANKYGMMGDSANGHSFIVVGPDGRIEHRADYGGAPDYTMYVPVGSLVADLRAGLRAKAS